MKYIVLCVTLIVSKSKLKYIKLHSFLKNKVAAIPVHRVENIRCKNELRVKFCFTLVYLYLELLFGKTLFFIQNKHFKITSAINPPLETILPIRIAITQ
jgi:hypothetical protein